MKPLTRLENFLAKIAGDPDAKMDMKPKTRKEMYLDAIASGGGSGGGGSVEPLVVEMVNYNDPQSYLSKNYNEIYSAIMSGRNVIGRYDETISGPSGGSSEHVEGFIDLTSIGSATGDVPDGGQYRVAFLPDTYVATTPDGKLIRE